MSSPMKPRSAFAAWVTGNVRLFAGDLHQAIGRLEDALAALPVAAVHGRQRVDLLLTLAVAAGLTGDEERAASCHRELAALTEAGGESIQRSYSALPLWAQGLAAWRQSDLQRAAELVQQSLRLRESGTDRMGYAHCLETLAWIAASGRQYERAAVLLGAAAGLWRSMGTTLDGNQPLAGYPPGCRLGLRLTTGR
jgi:non-specific serine/threonine protein kinase